MCGQAGLLFGERVPLEQMTHLLRRFRWMLLGQERRGPHATGVSWLAGSGEHRILKAPVPASRFIATTDFHRFLESIPSDATWLAGHTRWVTRGDAANNRNNHPLRTGSILGTHNGTLVNAGEVARSLGIATQTQVDTEVLLRFLDRTLSAEPGTLDCLHDGLAGFQGQMSAVAASKLAPHRILMIHGNKPLSLRRLTRHRLWAYASDDWLLCHAFPPAQGWRRANLPPMHLWATDLTRARQKRPWPFSFQAMTRIPKLEQVP